MNRITRLTLKNPICFIACGFGSGLSPFAPGTMGTIVAIPLYWLMSHLSLLSYTGVLLVSFLFGVYCCGYTAKAFGTHDHKAIVWDEIFGLGWTLLAVPPSIIAVIAGFLLFRLFDILKPWPINQIDEKVKGGFGIMLDDWLAAIYANLILLILLPLIAQFVVI